MMSSSFPVSKKSVSSASIMSILFIATLLVSTKNFGIAQTIADSQHDPQQNNDASMRERVDKFSSPSGDIYWRSSMQNPQIIDYLDRESLASFLDPQLGIGHSELTFLENQPSPSNNIVGQQAASPIAVPIGSEAGGRGFSGTRNYHSLINDFKQNYLLSNPLREGRAFKPKLMSTARGFGKRSGRANKIISQQRLFGDYLY